MTTDASLPPGLTRETKIRRDGSGRWFNDGVPISHPNLVAAFNRWIDVAPDGRFCLKNDINWAYVTIEGAPLFVRAARALHAGIEIELSDGRVELLDPCSLRQGVDGAVYCNARGGTLCAKFGRAAIVALGDQIGEDEKGLYLQVGPDRIHPPEVDDPLLLSRTAASAVQGWP